MTDYDYWEDDEHLLSDPDTDWWQPDHDGYGHWEPEDGLTAALPHLEKQNITRKAP